VPLGCARLAITINNPEWCGHDGLDAAPQGASVVILGAWLAGLTTALEQRQAGLCCDHSGIPAPRSRALPPYGDLLDD